MYLLHPLTQKSMHPAQNSACTCHDTSVSIPSSLKTAIIFNSDLCTMPFLCARHVASLYMQKGHHRSLPCVMACGVQYLKCCLAVEQPMHLWYSFPPSMLLQMSTGLAPGC
jgi:hypothetical protein